MQLDCRFCDHKQSRWPSCSFPKLHAFMYVHFRYPYFPCCSFFKLSSPGWPACWQRCSRPIWSGRSSSPRQSSIFKEGPVAVEASFLSTPPALAGSLRRHVNLFSIFPGATQVAPLLLQADHGISLPSPRPTCKALPEAHAVPGEQTKMTSVCPLIETAPGREGAHPDPTQQSPSVILATGRLINQSGRSRPFIQLPLQETVTIQFVFCT